MSADNLREMGERDMAERPLAEHQIEGRVFDCPHCGCPAYVMPMALITPEQAVAATLGQGTCHIDVKDNLNESEGMGDVWLECDECHWQMDYREAPSMPLNYCPNCGRKVVE